MSLENTKMKILICMTLAAVSLVDCLPDLSAMCFAIEKVDCLFEYVSDGQETVCASNNQTYQNFCFYSKVRCRFPDVHVIGVGTCKEVFQTTMAPSTTQNTTPKPTTARTTNTVTLTSKPPTTMKTTPQPIVMTTTTPPLTTFEMTTSSTMMRTMTSPVPIATTIDHVKEAFCASKNTVACPTDLDPICASDKTFYLNRCEFSKATCDNANLEIKDISFCTGV